MIKYEQFYRQYMIRRISDLDRIINLDEIPEMPRGAIVHCLDNLYKSPDDLTLIPNENNLFVKKDPPWKYYHVLRSMDPDPNDVIVPNDKGITPRTMGMLSTQLSNFRRDHNRNWKQCASIQAIPDRADVLGVVSYNTLFNIRIAGVYPQIRFMNYILACLVNSLARVRDMKRPHIVHIPIQTKIFDRALFIKALEMKTYDKGRDALLDEFKAQNFDSAENDKKGELTGKVERSVIRLPNDPFYLLMMHWLCFISRKSTFSIFEYIPKEMLPYVVLSFSSGNKVLMYSIPDMMKLNGSSDAILIRLIRQMNSLAISNEDEKLLRITETPEGKSAEEPKEISVKDRTNIPNEDAARLSTTIPEPDSNTEVLPKEFQVSNIELDLDDIAKVQPVNPKYVTVTPEEGHINAPVFSDDSKEEDLKQFIADTNAEITAISQRRIEENTHLTPLQKKKIFEISEEWKKVELDGKPLEKLVLQEPVTFATKPNEVDLKDFVNYGGDASMERSRISSFDEDYMKTTFHKNMAQVLTSFRKNGMHLTSIEKVDIVNPMSREEKWTVMYTDENRKKFPIRFTIPKVDEYGLLRINGSEKRLKKQRVSLPICKVSNSRVTLNANFNKTLVERNTSVAHSFYPYFLRMTEKAVGKKVIMDYGVIDLQGKVLPYEYTQLARHHPKITLDCLQLTFNFDDRMSLIDATNMKQDPEAFHNLEKEYGVFFGYDEKNRTFLFMELNGTVNVVDPFSGSLVQQDNFINLVSTVLECKMVPLQEWVEMKILDKQIPLGFVLCYRFGFLHMLKYLKVDYKIYPKGTRKIVSPSDVILDFADCSVVIRRVPYVNSLIFSGLNAFDLKDTLIAEMETKDIYYDLLQKKHFSLNYIKGIDTHFDFFIDPITADVLRLMHEPTNFKDLLIRATALLSTEEHLSPSSSSNFRIRGYEIIPALVYNEIARGLDRYRNKSLGATNVFSINAEAVKQRFLQDQLVSNTDGLNPIQDLRERTLFSHTGFGGRDLETFMINDRKFTDDERGIVSEATVAGSTVAVVAGLSMDPNIVNTYGMTKSKGVSELSPTEMLSTTALLLPGITQDDGKRAYLAGLQTFQYMPTKQGEVSLVRTGYERVLARRSRPPYAYPAKMNGKIVKIDEKIRLMKIQYEDGSEDVVPFGDQFSRNSASGFYNTNRMVINNFKEGDKFKGGDILSYNRDAFHADPYSKQVDWKIGVLANIALVECDDTLDDCSAITAPLAEKLEVSPVYPFLVMVSKNTVIHHCKKIGDSIEIREPVISYDKTEVPETLRTLDTTILDVLSKIVKVSEKANHAGTIARIEAFYTCPIEEMSESLQAVVKECARNQDLLASFSKGTIRENNYPPSTPISTDYRIEGVVPEDDSVVLKFFIKEDVDMDAGSKIVFSTELKSVVGYIIPKDMESESGKAKVQGLMSMRAVNARIVYSPFVIGASYRVLKQLNEDVIKMFDE